MIYLSLFGLMLRKNLCKLFDCYMLYILKDSSQLQAVGIKLHPVPRLIGPVLMYSKQLTFMLRYQYLILIKGFLVLEKQIDRVKITYTQY